VQPVDATPAHHRFRSSIVVMVAGYVALTGLLLAIGFLLTHPLSGTVGRWDESVNRNLSMFRRLGLIGREGRKIIIRNPAELRTYCE